MATLERAIQLAAKAHEGQLDKAGQPYILHPLRVMLALQPQGEDAMIVGALHDVVEDTSVTIDDLTQFGFDETIVVAINALTKQLGESKMDAAIRAAKNRIACYVKLADVRDNLDPNRIKTLREKDIQRNLLYVQVRSFWLTQLTLTGLTRRNSSMGREIRRVIPNWEHPMEQETEHHEKEFIPLRNESYEEAVEEVGSEFLDPYDYRPYWNSEEMTWYQLYETVTYGTPLSPPFEFPEQLVDYLVNQGDFLGNKWSRQIATDLVNGDGYAPTFIMDVHGLREGWQGI